MTGLNLRQNLKKMVILPVPTGSIAMLRLILTLTLCGCM